MSDSNPDPEFISGQLRKPSGSFAVEIARIMDGANEFLVDLTAETLRPKNGEHLLEIGFGSGTFIYRLFENAENIKYSGIEYSPEMVELARSNNEDLVQQGKVEFAEGSSDNLPYGDNTFDKVFCINVIYFWDDPSAHLREIHRVLKPGGKFYSGIRTKEAIKKFPFVKQGFNLYELDEWKSVLEENGFEFDGENRKFDPPYVIDGKSIDLESVCIVAKKS